MKTTILKALAAVLLASACMYATLAFAFVKPNPNNWGCEGRIILALIIMFFLIYAAAYISAKAEVKKLTEKNTKP